MTNFVLGSFSKNNFSYVHDQYEIFTGIRARAGYESLGNNDDTNGETIISVSRGGGVESPQS